MSMRSSSFVLVLSASFFLSGEGKQMERGGRSREVEGNDGASLLLRLFVVDWKLYAQLTQA